MEKPWKGKSITAEFIGINNTNGYSTFDTYKLEMRILPYKGIQIKDTERNNGTVTYSSFIKFLNEWDNIKTR